MFNDLKEKKNDTHTQCHTTYANTSANTFDLPSCAGRRRPGRGSAAQCIQCEGIRIPEGHPAPLSRKNARGELQLQADRGSTQLWPDPWPRGRLTVLFLFDGARRKKPGSENRKDQDLESRSDRLTEGSFCLLR